MAERDYPMTDRERGYQPDFGEFILKLDNTLSSFNSQINSLTNTMKEHQNQLKAINNTNQKFYQEFSRNNKTDNSRNNTRDRNSFGSIGSFRNVGSMARDIEEFRQELINSTRQLRRESREWKHPSRSFRGAGADIVASERRQQVMDDFARKYTDHQRYMEQRFQQEEELYKEHMDALNASFDVKQYERDIENLRHQRRFYELAARKANTQQEREEALNNIQRIKNIQKNKYEQKQKYDRRVGVETNRHNEQVDMLQSETREALNNLARERDSLLRNIDGMFQDIQDAFEDAQSGMDALKGQSRSVGEFMEDLEASKEQKFNEAVEKAREQVSDAIEALEKKLEEEGDLTDEEKLNIRQKLNILRQEEAYLRRLTPITDIWRKVGNDITRTLGQGFLNALDPIFKNIEDKYLQSYIDGFQKVYDSIENTRNTISARLKLNAGDYQQMQEALYQQIQDRGLAGSVSMTDVDDMLVSLQTAGITDQAMLQELAIEGAKLKAQGSSFDLGNEETLQQVMQMYSSSLQSGLSTQDALKSITNMMDELAATEVGIRQQFGYDAALVNGGLNTIFNQAAKMGVASGKGVAQIGTDVGSSMFASQALYSSGIDESLIRQSIQSIFDQTVSDQDVFAKMLISQGITRDALVSQKMDLGEAMQYVTDRMGDILSTADPQYIAEIGKAYALPGNVTDWLNMQQRQGALTVTPSDDFMSTLDQINQAENLALEQGTYLSETAQRQKEQENKATKKAIEAEQMYKGDQLIVGELQNIASVVNSIYQSLKGGLNDSIGSVLSGGMEAFGGEVGGQVLTGATSFGEGATQFLTGQAGTALGAAGTAIGVGIGAGWMIDSVVDNMGDSVGESILNVASDPQFYRGLGTTLGTVLGGPIGGAFGGAIGQIVSMGGNKLYDMITDMSDVTDEQMEAAKRLSEAGTSLNETALKQQAEIKSAQENIISQKEIFNNYDESMQKQFITQMDIDSTGLSNQEAFARAIQKWEQIELRKIEEMQLKQAASENTTLLSASMDKTIGGSLFEATKEVQEQQIQKLIDNNILTDESIISEYNDYGVEYLSDAQTAAIDKLWQQQQEQMTDLLNLQTEQGYKELELIKQQALRDYAQQNNLYSADGSLDLSKVEQDVQKKGAKLDLEAATKQLYAEQVSAGTVSAEDISTMANYADILEKNRSTWENDNSEFQSKWGQIVEKNPGASVLDLVEAYNKEFLNGKGLTVADVIDGFFVDSAGLYAQYTKGDKGYPQLRSRSNSGTRLYDPTIYHGKFETGLTDVPYDGYPAILDQGERVLTRKEADVYNELSSHAVRQLINQSSSNYTNSVYESAFTGAEGIRSSINNQTKTNRELLQQILDVLLKIYNQDSGATTFGNPVNRSARNMNTNITSLNTRI